MKRKNKNILIKLLLYIIIILLFSVFLFDFSNDKNKTIFGFSIWRLIAYFIIYSVLVSLQADQIFWGKREFGKEKTEVML